MSSSNTAISVKPLPVRVLKYLDGSSNIPVEDTPIRFGLYSDKFARFMSELMDIKSIMSKMSSNKYRDIREMTDAGNAGISVQLSNPSSLCKCENTRVSVSEGKLFKNQFGEICMVKSKLSPLSYYDNAYNLTKIAKAIKKSAILETVFDNLDTEITDFFENQLPDSVDPFKQKYLFKHGKYDYCVTLSNKTSVRDKIELKLPLTFSDIDVFVKDNDSKSAASSYQQPYTYINQSSVRYPYHHAKSINEERKIWNAKSTKPFLNTSFTIRDAYLIANLLAGKTKNDNCLKHYSQTEIDEMVGVKHDPLYSGIIESTAETVDVTKSSLRKQCIAEIERLQTVTNKKIADITQFSYVEYDNIINRFTVLYRDLVKDARDVEPSITYNMFDVPNLQLKIPPKD